MSITAQEQLKLLQVQIVAALADGRETDAADLGEEAAAFAVAMGDDARARQLLRDALDARGSSPDTPLSAAGPAVVKTAYGLALVEARSPQLQQHAADRFAEVAAVSQTARNHELAARASEHRAELAVSLGEPSGDVDTAIALLHEADAAWARTDGGAPVERVRVLRRRLLLEQVAGRVDAAVATLGTALSLAAGTAAEPVVLLDASMLAQLLGLPVSDQSVDEIVAAAHRTGQAGLVGYAQLLGATRADHATSLARASEVRQSALALRDPVLYLMACLQTASLADGAGDRVGALEVLFTCQASLAALLGEDGRLPVLVALHGLEQRWGRAAFEAARATYREQNRSTF